MRGPLIPSCSRAMAGLLLPVVLLLGLLAPLLTPAQAKGAQDNDRISHLMDLMGMDEIVLIMREEGLAYGGELGRDMLAGQGGPVWDRQVDRIYDEAAMSELVRAGFREAFGAADPEPLIRFFEGDTGRQIVALEIAARRAFMDEDIEETAREAFRQVAADMDAPSPRDIDPHLSAIEAYVEANDLIGFNVMGAMNANMLFYRGLIEGGALEMSEGEILSDVWEQEDETHAETREWLYAFLMLAYQPLEASQISGYADLSLTPPGRAMNRALFTAFDAMYGTLSHALGLAIAAQMLTEDL